VLAAADLAVAPDSAAFHLAAALSTPCVGVFGPTDGAATGRWYPLARVVQAAGTEALADLPVADVPATVCQWTVYVPWKAKVNKKSYAGSVRKVDWFSAVSTAPLPSYDYGYNYDVGVAVQQQANDQFESEAVASGVSPVKVTLPMDGQALYFEKLLVLDESLDVSFSYKMKKK